MNDKLSLIFAVSDEEEANDEENNDNKNSDEEDMYVLTLCACYLWIYTKYNTPYVLYFIICVYAGPLPTREYLSLKIYFTENLRTWRCRDSSTWRNWCKLEKSSPKCKI